LVLSRKKKREREFKKARSDLVVLRVVIQFRKNNLQDRFHTEQYFNVPESKNFKAVRCPVQRPSCIFAAALFVLTAIDLDDELSLQSAESGYEWAQSPPVCET
jgi:hypothetical protein